MNVFLLAPYHKAWESWTLVAHTCNSSYSGGRDQEDCGSKPARENSSVRPYLEKTHHKEGLME
jgi:hypothetical protein